MAARVLGSNAESKNKNAEARCWAAVLLLAICIGCGAADNDVEPGEAPVEAAGGEEEIATLRARVVALEQQIEAKDAEIRRLRTRALLAEAEAEVAPSEGTQTTDSSPVRSGGGPAEGEFTWNVNPASVYPIEVLEIDAKEVRRSDHYLTFAWRIVLRNVSDRRQAFRAEVQFMDRTGLAIDDLRTDLVKLDGQESRTITDQKVIARPGADSVESVRPLLELKLGRP
ncbi:MAG: hypothetical protein AAGD06_23220 [Acidobacteriota bacterium]